MPRRGVYKEQESFFSSRDYAIMVLTTAALDGRIYLLSYLPMS